MMEAPSLASLQVLLDRQAIHDCVYRYCRGLDRHDKALTASAFHADAVGDFGPYVGPMAPFPDYVNVLHAQKWASHQHYVLNHLCQPEGDSAQAETYWMVAGRCHDETLELNGGRYIDRFERRQGEWKIAQRVCVYEWGMDAEQAKLYAEHFLPGVRGHADVSYQNPPAMRPSRGVLNT